MTMPALPAEGNQNWYTHYTALDSAAREVVTGRLSAAQVSAASTADRARANHTGQQSVTTLSDFTEAVQDVVAGLLGAGSNVLITYDDPANTLSVSATGAGGTGLDAEQVRDAIGVALVGAGNIVVAVNDAADTITISTLATVNATDAALRARSSHTGTQAASTITGLAAVATTGAYADLIGAPTGGSGAGVVNPVSASEAGVKLVIDPAPTYQAQTSEVVITDVADGVPPGDAADSLGYVLTYVGPNPYDTQWLPPQVGGSSGGGIVTVFSSRSDPVPTGTTAGFILRPGA